MIRQVSVLISCALAALPFPTSGQSHVATRGPLTGQVVDANTGEPVMGVRVELGSGGSSAQTNRTGEFSFPSFAGDSVVLRAWRLGYATLDTTVVLGESPHTVLLYLQAVPIALEPLL